jgi:cytochrome c-type biogenesis protein
VRVAFLLLLSAVASGCDTRGPLKAPALGAPAPSYAAMDLSGARVSLDSLRGQVVVLNVWATWCVPCREEIPQLEALHQLFGSNGVRMIGVSIDAAGMGGDVQDFMREHDMHYAVWLDPDHDVSLKFLTVGVPETFVIDKAGIIRWRTIGAIRRGDSSLTVAIRRAMESSDTP